MPSRRFNLLQLEFGEEYIDDLACYHRPTQQSQFCPVPKSKGRLRICSGCVVFEPDVEDIPLLKFPFRAITSIEPHRPHGWVPGEESVIISCTQVVALRPDNVPGPYIPLNAESSHSFIPLHSRLESFLPLLTQLLAAAHLGHELARASVQQLLEERRANIAFDLCWLEDGLLERLVLDVPVKQVMPLVCLAGRLVITNLRLYLQPFSNLATTPVLKVSLGSVRRLEPRRFMQRHLALELFLIAQKEVFASVSPAILSARGYSSADSLLLAFVDPPTRDRAIAVILANLPGQDPSAGTATREACVGAVMDPRRRLRECLTLWQRREMSTFDYLMQLNLAAGRSFNDLTQYPVFPWVLADYHSEKLDLSDPSVYRDLSKPVGALGPARLAAYKARFEDMPSPRFLYGTHYSTPAYVLFYLVRQSPDLMLHLQCGRFDAADRAFCSISSVWNSVCSNPADVKELIPEFYGTDPGLLLNRLGLELGTRSTGEVVGDVDLPPWATSAEDFLGRMREALEGEVVSGSIHEWIDLIFGFKQRGTAAAKADNLFYPLTYEGAVDWSTITEPLQAQALREQIQEFGQCPRQLFNRAHPSRFPVLSDEATANWPGPEPEVTAPTSQRASQSEQEVSLMPQKLPEVAEPPARLPPDAVEPCNLVARSRWTANQLDPASPLRVQGTFRCREAVTDCGFTHDGRTLVCSSQEGGIGVYCMDLMRQVRRFRVGSMPLSSLAVLPCSPAVLTGSFDNAIYLVSLDSGQVLQELSLAHDDAVTCLSLAPGPGPPTALVSGSWDATVKLWSLDGNGVGRQAVGTLGDHEVAVSGVHHGEGSLAASVDVDGGVKLWDTRNGGRVSELANAGASAVRLGDGASRPRLVAACLDGVVRSWELSELDRGPVHQSVCGIGSLRCLASDGNQWLVGDDDGKLWWGVDEEDYSSKKTLHSAASPEESEISGRVGHDRGVTCLCAAFSNDVREGFRVCSGSLDASIQVRGPC